MQVKTWKMTTHNLPRGGCQHYGPELCYVIHILVWQFKATMWVCEGHLHQACKPCVIGLIPSQTYGGGGIAPMTRFVSLVEMTFTDPHGGLKKECSSNVLPICPSLYDKNKVLYADFKMTKLNSIREKPFPVIIHELFMIGLCYLKRPLMSWVVVTKGWTVFWYDNNSGHKGPFA